MNRFAKTIFGLLLGLAAGTFPLEAAVVKDAHTELELVSEGVSVQPGGVFTVALRFRMDPGWHIYWKNPGDAGLAPEVEWELPEGVSAGPLQFPYPRRIDLSTLTNYGYEGEVFLLADLEVSKALKPGETVMLRAEVSWLACEINCIPGEGTVELSLPVSRAPPNPDSRWVRAFAQTRNELPLAKSSWELQAESLANRMLLRILFPPWSAYALSDLQFFAEDPELVQHAEAQPARPIQGGYELQIKKSSIKTELPKRLRGVLVSKEGWRGPGSEKALLVDIPLNAVKGIPEAEGPSLLVVFLAFAFIGGLILNLMPCVLPVLSLKILGFVKQAGEDSSKLLRHGFFFTGGVLVSFWFLAGLLLALRAGGQEIGWGFQLQSPAFLVALSVLFFVFALNLFGVFEVGLSLGGLESRRVQGPGFWSSFSSGVLATVVATPCTAPFMGSALGFALTQSAFVSFGIFTFLALGMAAPFLLLCANPRWVRFIPKPGPWMGTLKQFLGFLLMATVLWLLWVLQIQTGQRGTLVLLGVLFLTGFGTWILGRWGTPQRSVAVRRTALFLSLLIILGSVSAGLAGIYSRADAPGRERLLLPRAGSAPWRPYSEKLLEKSLAEEKGVFIDFTAAWCLTCQVNKRVALNSPKVIQRFEELETVLLKADWTSQDKAITRALARYGRNSIPLYVYYPAGSREPLLLPELLTPAIVLEALETSGV